jgi:hypothetical protein
MAGGERPWTWILCSETVMISMHRGGLEDTVKTGRFGFLLIPCSLHEMPKFPYTVCRKSADWLPLVLPGILTQKKRSTCYSSIYARSYKSIFIRSGQLFSDKSTPVHPGPLSSESILTGPVSTGVG